MSPSTSALIVAVVGVVGTLASGVLAHRGALRSQSMEFEHAERQRRAEQSATARRESVTERKSSYTAFNQLLRQFHLVLSQHFLALEAGQSCQQPTADRDEPRNALRNVYAEAQMVVPDDVLAVGGGVVHQLNRIHFLLAQHERQDRQEAAEESLEDIRRRLEHASEGLYEVRQTMRRDLGITELPVQRPDEYGQT